MMKSHNACLLFDIGGTFIKSGVMNRTGEMFPHSMFIVEVDSNGTRDQIIASFERAVDRGMEYLCDNSLDIDGIGIAIPGPFDYRKGISLMTHKFKAIYGMDLTETLYNLTGISRNVPIVFMHDVNTALEGELWVGNAREYPTSALITLGTGLGFAFSREGVVQRSALGSPLITIFKTPYGNGILEDYVSKRGFMHAYGELAGIVRENMTVEQIGKQADEGDPASIRTFETVAGIIAEATKNILYEQRIECLLFGGQISKSYGHMEKKLREGLSGLPDLKKIDTAKYMEQSAFYGIIRNIILRQGKLSDQRNIDVKQASNKH